MLIYVVIASTVFVFGDCGEPVTYDVIRPVKHGHHYYDPYYHHFIYKSGLITYFAFLAIKVKLALALGAFFTFFLFAGKLFAIIKYAEYMKDRHYDHHHEPEKVYVQPPAHYEHDFKSADLPGDFSPGGASDKLSRPMPWLTRYKTLPPFKYMAGGRSMENETWRDFIESRKYDDVNSFSDGWMKFSELIRRINITDKIFTELGVVTTNCREKYICDLQKFSKGNWVLEGGLKLFRDDLYEMYEAREKLKEDCEQLEVKECVAT